MAVDRVDGLPDGATTTGPLERQASKSPKAVPANGLHTAYETVPVECYLGPHGTQQWLVNKQGLRLKNYLWPADRPANAVLVFAHGHGAHSLFELLRVTVSCPLVVCGAPSGGVTVSCELCWLALLWSSWRPAVRCVLSPINLGAMHADHCPAAGLCMQEAGRPPVYVNSWVERFNKAGISVAAIDNQVRWAAALQHASSHCCAGSCPPSAPPAAQRHAQRLRSRCASAAVAVTRQLGMRMQQQLWL